MWGHRTSGAVVAMVLTLVGPAVAGDAKGKRPKLGMRATPRFAFAPTNVLFTAELSGGAEVEELYCPGLEWSWGDGEISVQEGDCPPFGPESVLDRVFMGRHAYRMAGRYEVRLSLVRSGQRVAVAATTIEVRPGLGSGERAASLWE